MLKNISKVSYKVIYRYSYLLYKKIKNNCIIVMVIFFSAQSTSCYGKWLDGKIMFDQAWRILSGLNYTVKIQYLTSLVSVGHPYNSFGSTRSQLLNLAGKSSENTWPHTEVILNVALLPLNDPDHSEKYATNYNLVSACLGIFFTTRILKKSSHVWQCKSFFLPWTLQAPLNPFFVLQFLLDRIFAIEAANDGFSATMNTTTMFEPFKKPNYLDSRHKKMFREWIHQPAL